MRKAVGSCILATAALTFSSGLTSASISRTIIGHAAPLSALRTGAARIGPSSVPRLHAAWTYPIGSVIGSVATDSRVFLNQISARGDLVVMLDAQTGKVLRSFTAASLHFSPEALAYAEGRLIVAGTKTTIAINPETGKRYWSAPAGATSLNVIGGTIYTGKYCQNSADVCGPAASYAVSLSNGRVLWKHAGAFTDAPDLIAGRLYQVVGGGSDQTRVYDPASGTLVAELPYGALWLGDKNTIYAYALVGPQPGARPAKRGWLGRISSTGKPVWKLNVGVVWPGSAVLDHGMLYVDSNRFHPGVIAVKGSNGQIQWGGNLGKDLLLRVVNQLVFVLDPSNGTLSVLNSNNGRVLRQIVVPHSSSVSPGRAFQALLLQDDTLYAVGNGVVALRP
jgi:outer membrane protein assembly factor BamB